MVEATWGKPLLSHGTEFPMQTQEILTICRWEVFLGKWMYGRPDILRLPSPTSRKGSLSLTGLTMSGFGPRTRVFGNTWTARSPPVHSTASLSAVRRFSIRQITLPMSTRLHRSFGVRCLDLRSYPSISETGRPRAQIYSNYVRVGPTSRTSWKGGLIGGKTYYAKLWTESKDPAKGCSSSAPCLYVHSIKFTTAAHPLPHNPNSFYENVAAATEAVRNMASGNDNRAIDSTFLKYNLDPSHQGLADCADFANNLLNQLQNQGIVARRRNMVFGAGPASHTIVEYYDPIQGKWAGADATFGFLLYDPSKNPATMSVDEVASTLNQGAAGAIPFQFVTSASNTPGCPQCFGSYWVENFLTDPILDYLNPNGVETLLPPLYDPTKSLVNAPGAIGAEGVYIFSFANPTDSAVLQDLGVPMVVQPLPAPWDSDMSFGNFSATIKLDSGWSFVTTPPPGMLIKKSTCPLFAGPNCP
jgi:hypothetical protein